MTADSWSDNGPEYISKAVAKYLDARRINHEKIEPGKPIQNCYAESFLSRFREECLNLNLFKNKKEARKIIGDYIEWFNNERLHSGLGYRTPAEVAGRATKL
ncbi:MAG: integrase core domain-containing protein [Candidatus Eremiobacteraeota bacterium]|nr:integrase core domain-containing protein [Candidatus Eremiobacteraeota bacterium]